MINREDLNKLKEITQDFFSSFGFDSAVEKTEISGDTVFISIKTEDPKILIGQNGQTLLEIQHLIRSISRKKISEPFRVEIDINNYKEKKLDYLKETARSAADDVAITRKEKVLMPMMAYERRVIHMELKDRSDVKTHSIGEGETRRIVVSPA